MLPIIDDAEHYLGNGQHTVPFAPEFQNVAGPSIRDGATAFIGTLTGSPGSTYEYDVPYTSDDLPIPGVWISESDGRWLADQLANGPVRVRLNVESTVSPHTSYNIVGDLPGADDELVIVGSHHDGRGPQRWRTAAVRRWSWPRPTTGPGGPRRSEPRRGTMLNRQHRTVIDMS
jgi:hypothetical protein